MASIANSLKHESDVGLVKVRFVSDTAAVGAKRLAKSGKANPSGEPKVEGRARRPAELRRGGSPHRRFAPPMSAAI